MIVKGRARSGGAQLAAYLLREDGKERATLIQIFDGSHDLHKALVQWELIGEATRGTKPIYHAQISPEARYPMTPEKWIRAAELLAEDLGMADHPRALVVHEGGDNPHAHVVFQRTDADSMRMWPTNKNYEKHEAASKRMEDEFGHENVPGKHRKRDRQKQPEFPRAKSDQPDHQQAERTELTVDERKEQVTALRAASDSAPAFKHALAEAGYILAKGDKRGLVIVDAQGEVYSLSRQVTDLKAKEFKAFMDGIDPKTLPSVSDAKQMVEEAKAKQTERPPVEKPATAAEPEKKGVEASKFWTPETPSKVEQPAPAPRDERLEALERSIAERYQQELKKTLDLHALQLRQTEFEMDRRRADKLKDFDALRAEERQLLKDRHEEQRTGIAGFIHAMKMRLNPTLAAEETAARRKEANDLVRRQAKERADYVKLLDQEKGLEVGNLKERQALQLRDLSAKNDTDRDRYIQEHKDAQRIALELKRQQEERDRQRRDGPEPPGPRVR
jgi:hypothetical protein